VSSSDMSSTPTTLIVTGLRDVTCPHTWSRRSCVTRVRHHASAMAMTTTPAITSQVLACQMPAPARPAPPASSTRARPAQQITESSNSHHAVWLLSFREPPPFDLPIVHRPLQWLCDMPVSRRLAWACDAQRRKSLDRLRSAGHPRPAFRDPLERPWRRGQPPPWRRRFPPSRRRRPADRNPSRPPSDRQRQALISLKLHSGSDVAAASRAESDAGTMPLEGTLSVLLVELRAQRTSPVQRSRVHSNDT